MRNKLSAVYASKVGLANADEGVCRFRTIHPKSKRCYFWELSRKHPYMLTACKSVVQMIALAFSKYQPIIICSACGSLVTKYVDHCVPWLYPGVLQTQVLDIECGLVSGINMKSILPFD